MQDTAVAPTHGPTAAVAAGSTRGFAVSGSTGYYTRKKASEAVTKTGIVSASGASGGLGTRNVGGSGAGNPTLRRESQEKRERRVSGAHGILPSSQGSSATTTGRELLEGNAQRPGLASAGRSTTSAWHELLASDLHATSYSSVAEFMPPGYEDVLEKDTLAATAALAGPPQATSTFSTSSTVLFSSNPAAAG